MYWSVWGRMALYQERKYKPNESMAQMICHFWRKWCTDPKSFWRICHMLSGEWWKEMNDVYCNRGQIFWQSFYSRVLLIVFSKTFNFCANLSIWYVAMATERRQTGTYSKSTLQKLDNAVNSYECSLSISLYKKCFYCRCWVSLTSNSRIEYYHFKYVYCGSILDLLKNFFRNVC